MPAEPVAVNAVFAGNTYQIAFAEEMEHGTLTAPETAVCGSTVTITPQPDAGYMLDTLTAADANGQLLEIDEENFAFTMPASNVTLNATFTTV